MDATPSSGTAGPGTAECSFGLHVGSQGLQVLVTTIDNFASNPGYVFPNKGTLPTPTPVSGLPGAVLQKTNGSDLVITSKLGSNALAILVNFYTKPVDESFVTALMRAALSKT